MPQYIAKVHRIVDCTPIQSVAQKWIKVAIKAFSHELDFSALNGHHERSDTSVSYSIDVCIVMLHKLLECFQIARSACKVQRCSSKIIFCRHVRCECHYLSKFISITVTRCVH